MKTKIPLARLEAEFAFYPFEGGNYPETVAAPFEVCFHRCVCVLGLKIIVLSVKTPQHREDYLMNDVESWIFLWIWSTSRLAAGSKKGSSSISSLS